MLKRIHVNQYHIKKNRKEGTNLPVFAVKTYRENRKGNSVQIHGPSHLVYTPDNPLNCGAVAYIETEADVDVD